MKSSQPQDRTDRQRSTLACSGARIKQNTKNQHLPRNVSGNCLRILKKVWTTWYNSGMTEFSISILGKKFKLSRKTMSKHKIRLEKLGLIKRIPRIWPPMYRLTNKTKNLNVSDFSYGTTRILDDEKIGMEDVYITIPRSPDSKNAILPKGFWEKINLKLNNTIQKHTHIKLGDYEVAVRETSKSIIIQMNGIRLNNFTEAFVVYNVLVNRLFRVLAHYDYWIDPENASCSDPEFTYLSDLERSQKDLNRNPRVKVKLGYPRTKILPNDKLEEAWAKFDDTPDEGNFETNDLNLARERRIFPLRISQLLTLQENQTEAINTYAKEIGTHLETYRDMKQAIGQFREALDGFKRVLSRREGTSIPSHPPEANTKLPEASTRKSEPVLDLDRMDPEDKIQIRILEDLPGFTLHDPFIGNREISKLKKGAKIFVTVKQAKDLIEWKEAELV